MKVTAASLAATLGFATTAVANPPDHSWGPPGSWGPGNWGPGTWGPPGGWPHGPPTQAPPPPPPATQPPAPPATPPPAPGTWAPAPTPPPPTPTTTWTTTPLLSYSTINGQVQTYSIGPDGRPTLVYGIPGGGVTIGSTGAPGQSATLGTNGAPTPITAGYTPWIIGPDNQQTPVTAGTYGGDGFFTPVNQYPSSTLGGDGRFTPVTTGTGFTPFPNAAGRVVPPFRFGGIW